MISSRIDALFTGKPKQLSPDGKKSSIARSPTGGPVMLRTEGLDGDEVADKFSHGGPDKALHLYPAEHYPFWIEKLGGHPLLRQSGAFGENISATGLTEERIKIGDKFRVGNALIEVSHGRQPCWKIDHHFGVKGLSKQVIKTKRCGLYFRVLEEGKIAPGDAIEQIYAADHGWSVARVFNLLIAGGHTADGAALQLKEIIQLEPLARVWRDRARGLC